MSIHRARTRPGRHPRRHRRLSGFTLIELVIVIVLVAVFILAAIDNMLPMRAEAERVAMQQTLGALRSALGIEVASRILRQGSDSVADLADSNPMRLLSEVPGNYVGELSQPPDEAPRGHWYFDPAESLLVYRIRYVDRFRTPLSGPARARFRVALTFDDRDGDGRFTADEDVLNGVRLAPVEAYEWLPPEGWEAPWTG